MNAYQNAEPSEKSIQTSDTPKPPTMTDRLRAELAANKDRGDHDPVTDSSLTYGDLRKLAKQSALMPEAERAVEEYSCRTEVSHIASEMSALAARLRSAL